MSMSEPPPEPANKHRSIRRFQAAMAGYVVLAALAVFTLEGALRLATLIFLGGLAAKTWIAHLKDGAPKP